MTFWLTVTSSRGNLGVRTCGFGLGKREWIYQRKDRRERKCVGVSHHTSAPIAHAASTWRQKLSLPGFILSSQEPLYSGTLRISGEHSNTSMWCTMASLPGVITDSYWQKQREMEKQVKNRELFYVFLLLKAATSDRYANKIKCMQQTMCNSSRILFYLTFLYWICSHFFTSIYRSVNKDGGWCVCCVDTFS